MQDARVIAVFGSSTLDPTGTDYEEARRCGEELARAGFAVATGGYGGTMEAVSRGAGAAGGHVYGVTAPNVFTGRDGPNRFVHTEQAQATLPSRIAFLVDLADGFIALPGSLGTFTELMVAWNAGFVETMYDRTPIPLCTVGDQWRRLVESLGFELETVSSTVNCVDNVDQAVAALVMALGGGDAG